LNTNDFISSGVLESFVLGTATQEEIKLVNELCRKHPEVLQEIEAIEQSLMIYAAAEVPELSGLVKEKLFSQLPKNNSKIATSENKIHQLKSENYFRYYKIAVAASMALLLMSSAFNIYFYNKLQKTTSELEALNTEKQYYADQFNVQQTSLKNAQNDLAELSNPEIKIIKLNSIGIDAGKPVSALIYWNATTHKTYINSIQLPAPPEGKQYQLWALVDGKPVDAGVFDVLPDSVSLQKMKDITGAQTFAVTIEVKGGSPTPTLSEMCLLGNI